jgi:hypothetical protein
MRQELVIMLVAANKVRHKKWSVAHFLLVEYESVGNIHEKVNAIFGNYRQL